MNDSLSSKNPINGATPVPAAIMIIGIFSSSGNLKLDSLKSILIYTFFLTNFHNIIDTFSSNYFLNLSRYRVHNPRLSYPFGCTSINRLSAI